MLEQRIQQHFFDSADLKVQSADSLVRPIQAATQAVLGAITSASKVLTWGVGDSHRDAKRLAALLMGRQERERPALPALALDAAGEEDATPWQTALRQLQALGSAGDVLVLLAASAACEASMPARQSAPLTALIEAAHDQDLTVVLFSGRGADAVAAQLSEADVHVAVNHERPMRVQEVHGLALHCLLDAVDLQLLGDEES